MELMVIEELKAVDVFKKGGAQQIIDSVREKATAEVFDVNTAKGRESIASMAYKVAKSKTALDKLGKELTDRLNAQKAPIMDERNLIKTELDKVRDEVRQPLTEYEEADKLRIAQIKQKIECISDHGPLETVSELAKALAVVKATVVNDESFAEFEALAYQAKVAALADLGYRLAAREKYDNDQAELAQHRADKEKREQEEAADKAQKAEDERTRKAEEKARKQAEEAKLAAEKRLEDQKIQADKDKQALLKQAEQDMQAAIDAERRKGEAEKAAEEDRLLKIKQKEERAAANKNHQKRVNKEAVADLVAVGFANDTAKEVIIAISSGVIKHVTINYRGIS